MVQLLNNVFSVTLNSRKKSQKIYENVSCQLKLQFLNFNAICKKRTHYLMITKKTDFRPKLNKIYIPCSYLNTFMNLKVDHLPQIFKHIHFFQSIFIILLKIFLKIKKFRFFFSKNNQLTKINQFFSCFVVVIIISKLIFQAITKQ